MGLHPVYNNTIAFGWLAWEKFGYVTGRPDRTSAVYRGRKAPN